MVREVATARTLCVWLYFMRFNFQNTAHRLILIVMSLRYYTPKKESQRVFWEGSRRILNRAPKMVRVTSNRPGRLNIELESSNGA